MKFVAALVAVLWAAAGAGADLVDHVDPFIGTGGHGHTFPGPTCPFGMVQVGPDTRLTGWDGCSGYHFSDNLIRGFSHTHLSGTGVGDYCDILFKPFTSELMITSTADTTGNFAKSDERAEAGYYRVWLDVSRLEVELTATPRTGLHRYRCPEQLGTYVVIDLEHRDQVLGSDLRVVGDDIVEGHRRSSAWARDQLVYFRARFSHPFSVLRSDSTGCLLAFGDVEEVLAQVATSAVDLDGARRNLEAEWADFDFETTRDRAHAAWAEALDRFEIDGATDAERTVFATSLYHSFIAPNLFSDVDGRYRGMDLAVHRTEDRDHYTVFSLWDTYRATHPLFTLVERERTGDFIGTMLAQYEQGGRLPVWELAANETDCMIGYHSVSVIADAWLKGIRGWDGDLALDAMVHGAMLDHFGLEAYKRSGFIGADEEGEAVSKTLEYAYDDACIARMAAALGRDDIARTFDIRAQAWRHLLDPRTRCFRPRRNGQWLADYDPRRVDFNHTEANGWQYRFAAPHHASEHVEALGGDEAFTAVLDSLFTIDSATTGRDQVDITGCIGQYAHGNEPSHHIAWLYHFTGHPEKTRARVARILEDFYLPTPDGLIGNEDCGQMSSWYVLAALGLYDVAPTSGQWLIIPPLHERMGIDFEDGRRFITRRVGEGAVNHVTFNGEALGRSFLTHDEVIGGGELVFHLSEAGDWGRTADDRPQAWSVIPPILTAPWAEADADRFRGSLEVRLACAETGAEIRWTADPDLAPKPGAVYTGPITIDSTTTLRFMALDGDRTSPVVTARFDAIEHDWLIDIASVPSVQYTAGGPDALIDGRRGLDSWRTGAWQGYETVDFVATLDLGTPTVVTRAGASFLQDMRSWIWMPTEVRVEYSEDGRTFAPAGVATHDVPDDVEGVFRRDLTVDLGGRTVRALRFHAVNYRTCPEWHPGAGGEAFIFIDEVIVDRE